MADDELKRLFESMRQENAEAQLETRRLFDESVTRLSADTRQYFDVATEATKHEIQLVAEGVSDTREALSRESADIRNDMQRGFAETQAMIKFSHSELDRRLIALEER